MDFTIYFPSIEYKIDLDLHGVTSYFPTRRTNDDDLSVLDRVDLILPMEWNPHDERFQLNEKTAFRHSILEDRPMENA